MQFLRHAKALPTSAALSLRGVVRETLPATLVETVRRVRTRPPLGANADWFRERGIGSPRSEEHTSELQSRLHLVCRLLLEKKKTDHASEAMLEAKYRQGQSGRSDGSTPQ